MITGEPIGNFGDKMRRAKMLRLWESLGREQQQHVVKQAQALAWLQDHPVLCAECGQPRVLLQHWTPKIRIPFICEECKRG